MTGPSIVILFLCLSWPLRAVALWQEEGMPYYHLDAEGREHILMEEFYSTRPYQWRASLVANSCNRVTSSQCTLTVNQQERFVTYVRLFPHTRTQEVSPARMFLVDHFYRAFWNHQGLNLPLHPSGPRGYPDL